MWEKNYHCDCLSSVRLELTSSGAMSWMIKSLIKVSKKFPSITTNSISRYIYCKLRATTFLLYKKYSVTYKYVTLRHRRACSTCSVNSFKREAKKYRSSLTKHTIRASVTRPVRTKPRQPAIRIQISNMGIRNSNSVRWIWGVHSWATRRLGPVILCLWFIASNSLR